MRSPDTSSDAGHDVTGVVASSPSAAAAASDAHAGGPLVTPTTDGMDLEGISGRPTRRMVVRSGAIAGAMCLAGVLVDDRSLTADVRLDRGNFMSDLLPDRRIKWRLAVPPAPRALVIALHGKGGSSGLWFDVLDAPRIAARTGLAIAAIDGGRSYWHPRRHSDALGMIQRDFLPRLASRGLPTDRIGLTGVSMGGYGALRLATLLPRDRVIGVATMSAALRKRYADTSQGAFDDDADFAHNSIFANLAPLRSVPLWLACGHDDRFFAGNVALSSVLPQAVTSFDRGGHTTTYCRRHWTTAMEWMATQV